MPPSKTYQTVVGPKSTTKPFNSDTEVTQSSDVAHWNGTPSLSDMLKVKAQENSKLRNEREFLHRVQQLGEEFRAEVEYVTHRLQLAVEEFKRVKRNLRH